MLRWLARVVLSAALVAWATGLALVLSGDTAAGLKLGVPAAFVLLVFAWRRVGVWLPDGGGGPW